VIAQNGKFYGRFPGDAEQVRRIVRFLIGQPEGGVKTPSGNFLSPRGLQSLGMQGVQTSDTLHIKGQETFAVWLVASISVSQGIQDASAI